MCSGNCSGGCSGCESIEQPIINGEDGAPGQDGASAYAVAVADGFVGDETAWLASLVGPSAYEVAVDNGFVGNEAAWLASLRGDNAWTLTTAAFTVPSIGSSVAVNVINGNFQGLGSRIYVVGAGYFRQFGATPGNPITVTVLKNEATSYTGQAAPGTVIPTGTLVMAAGEDGPQGLQGPAGAAGAAGTNGTNGTNGANGTTPTTRAGTGNPSNGLGVDGDIYIQQMNGGKLQWYYKSGGVYSALVSGVITSSRFLGYSSTDPIPNPGGAAANPGDLYATQIGSFATLYSYDGTNWNAVWVIPFGGGGGGTDTLTTVIANSAGQLSGSLSANWQSQIFWVPTTQSTSAVGTTKTFITNIGAHILNIGHDSTTINYTDPPYDGWWVFTIVNTTTGELSFDFAAGRWSKNSELALAGPVVVPGTTFVNNKVSLICRYFNGKMNVVSVQSNTTDL